MERRDKLQLFNDAQEDTIHFFTYHTKTNSIIRVFGVEMGGIIYYCASSFKKFDWFVFIIPTFDDPEEIAKLYLDFSKYRLGYIKSHFPVLYRTVEDGMNDVLRFDRGAFTIFDNAMALAKKIQYNWTKEENPFANQIIVDAVKQLISQWYEICQETKWFETAPTLWEKIRLTTGELFDIATTTPMDFFNPEIYVNRQMSNLIDIIIDQINNQ